MTVTGRDWWFAGLEAVGQRPFSDEEATEARTIAAEAARKIALIVGGIVLLPIVVIASFYVPGLEFVLAPGFMLIVSVMWQRRALVNALRYWRTLHLDVRAGVIIRCEGTLDDLLVSRAHLLGEPPSMVRISGNRDERVTIEVLPLSRRLWSCDGRRASHTVVVPKSSTAPPPEHAEMAANFVRPVNAEFAMHQRTLTRAEIAELEGYAPAVDPARYVLAALLLGGAVSGFWLAVQHRTDSLLLAGGFSIGAFLAIARLIRDAFRRRKISRDVSTGAVLIVRARKSEELGEAHEYLPHSGILWSTAGVPAAWRRLFR